MKSKLLALAVVAYGCWSLCAVIAQEPLVFQDEAVNPEVAELRQQVAELQSRVEQLEAERDVADSRTRFVFDAPFSGKSTDQTENDQHVTMVGGGDQGEGMMIDAIEHKIRWDRHMHGILSR